MLSLSLSLSLSIYIYMHTHIHKRQDELLARKYASDFWSAYRFYHTRKRYFPTADSARKEHERAKFLEVSKVCISVRVCVCFDMITGDVYAKSGK